MKYRFKEICQYRPVLPPAAFVWRQHLHLNKLVRAGSFSLGYINVTTRAKRVSESSCQCSKFSIIRFGDATYTNLSLQYVLCDGKPRRRSRFSKKIRQKTSNFGRRQIRGLWSPQQKLVGTDIRTSTFRLRTVEKRTKVRRRQNYYDHCSCWNCVHMNGWWITTSRWVSVMAWIKCLSSVPCHVVSHLLFHPSFPSIFSSWWSLMIPPILTGNHALNFIIHFW